MCSAFEAAWSTGQRPRIEAYLQTLHEGHRRACFPALLERELRLRRLAGEQPAADEYLQRFADFGSAVREVFEGARENGGKEKAQARRVEQQAAADSPTILPQAGGSGKETNTVPRQFGRYRILRQLGHGAMGTVYLAQDEQLNRRVALKIPHASVLSDPGLSARFQREAQAAALLHHPNICPIYDTGQIGDLPYICMAFVQGRSLSHYAVVDSGLSERQIATIVLKLARALHEAHARGIIHRDLKPANIMIDVKGEPIIMDFGLARHVDQTDQIRLTQTGMTLGSPAYMSPEQVEGVADKIGPASDVYSLGVILYELLTGELPFQGSIGVVMGQILNQDPPKPSLLRPDVSVRIELIWEKMMARRFTERYTSMKDVADALNDYLRRAAARETRAAKAGTRTATVSPARRVAQRCEAIKGMVRDGLYARAIEELQKVAANTDPDVADHAAWAAARLPLVKRERENVRAQRQDTFRSAKQMFARNDYEQAAEILGDFPEELRTGKMQELYEEAADRADEVSLLEAEIDDAERRGRHDARILASIDRLIELRPEQQSLLALRRQVRRKRQRGPISRTLGRSTPKFLRGLPGWADWALAAALFIGMTFVGVQGVQMIRSAVDVVSDGGGADDSADATNGGSSASGGVGGAEGSGRKSGSGGTATPGRTPVRRYVNAVAPVGGDGRTWETAWRDLRKALESARRDAQGVDEIWVAAGLYHPAQGDNQQAASFELVDGVSVYGGFIGSETRREQRDWRRNKTVLSGDLRNDDRGPMGNREDRTYADNSYNVVVADGLMRPAVLDGVTIRNGVARGASPDIQSSRTHGGGMRIANSDLLVRNCRFVENYANTSGGAVLTVGAGARFEDCVFENNFAKERGGAAYCHGRAANSPPAFVRCSFDRNVGRNGGGAILCGSAAQVRVANSRFVGNQTTISTTSAGVAEGGGAIQLWGGKITITNSLFNENRSVAYGGAINANAASEIQSAQNTFHGNRASRGNGNDVSISDSVRFTASGCIFWNNHNSPFESFDSSTVTVSYSCVHGGRPGTGNIATDPLFTSTVTLVPGRMSPCVDTVPLSALPPDAADVDGDDNRTEPVPVDLAGRPRKQSTMVDMGAFESSGGRTAGNPARSPVEAN